MQGYRIDLRLRSSHITPLQADTVFGHLCWAARYAHGEKRLADLLEAFREGVPLVLSDGLPSSPAEGAFYLPAPLLPLLRQTEIRELMKDRGMAYTRANRQSVIGALKAIRNLRFLRDDVWQHNRNGLCARRLLDDVLSLTICPRTGGYNDECPIPARDAAWARCPAFEGDNPVQCGIPAPGAERELLVKNTIDRYAGGTIEGRLFSVEEQFPRTGYSVYVRLDPNAVTVEELQEWLTYVEQSGFGKDKSTGKGALQVTAMQPFEFSPVEGSNAFVSLSSSYVPQDGDPRQGYYELHVKRGKLGGHYVLEKRPWKRPVIMYRAGSVFFWDTPRQAVGGLVGDVHPEDSSIVQYGCAYPLPIRLEGVAAE